MIMIFLAPVTVLFMLLVVTHPDLDDALLVLMTCKPFFSQSESFGNAWLTPRKINVNHDMITHRGGWVGAYRGPSRSTRFRMCLTLPLLPRPGTPGHCVFECGGGKVLLIEFLKKSYSI